MRWPFGRKSVDKKLLGLLSLWHIFETVELNRPELTDKLRDLTVRLEQEFEEDKALISRRAESGTEEDVRFIIDVLSRLPAPPAKLGPLPDKSAFTWERAESEFGPVGKVVNRLRVAVQTQAIAPLEKEITALKRRSADLIRTGKGRDNQELKRLQEELTGREEELQEEVAQIDKEFRRYLSVLLRLYQLSEHCINALGRVQSPSGIQRLVDLLSEGTPTERVFALKALLRANWRPQGTTQVLNFELARAKLSDSEAERKQALKELEKLLGAIQDSRELREAVEPRLAEEGMTVLQTLALSRLAEIDQKEAVRRFGEIFNTPDEPEELKSAVVLATGERLLPVMPVEAVNIILRALDDLDMPVRVAAAGALTRLPAGIPEDVREAAMERLIFALRDGDLEVRDAAARALNPHTYPAAGEKLVHFLLNETNPSGREFAARALGLNFPATPHTTAALIKALTDEDAAVRRAAADALVAQGAVPTEPQSRLEFLCARQEWQALVNAGKPAVVCLLPRLRDLREDIRLEVVRTLGRIGAPEAVNELCVALSDASQDVRRAAAKALGAIGDPAAAPALRTAISREGFKEVRAEMERALRQLS